MTWTVQNLWLIPALPLLAAGVTALLKQRHRTLAASLAIGSMVGAFFLACGAFAQTLGGHGEGHETARQVCNIPWFQLGAGSLKLGWVLDPLTAAMLVMVTFVSTLIFIYSVGYMAHDGNFTRFFTFLSLFAAAMLGLVIANNLLMLFMCWELVGLASYLLIGFWYHKPSAAAAAKKAFITTRVGDVFFFLGLLWLYAETGTLLFYDDGHGCLEQSALMKLAGASIGGGMAVSTAIALLIFCGAVGKSGQVPLHVWLPDAMEGPTPVSALIHAATMVAAGVFLIARVFPLMAGTMVHDNMAGTGGQFVLLFSNHSPALQVVTWIGAITAIFAALVAVAQTDIKRILAYSTVSQLGFMFVGLGTGGPAVGMFHLLTHAFFKALLFLGAGSVIHGCHEEQDIRRMGGLRKLMPVTFATYAIGMLALAGFPLVTSGFWSKDEILHSAWLWEPSKWPFVLATFGALLTAFYMTRQMFYVFFGVSRASERSGGVMESGSNAGSAHHSTTPSLHHSAAPAHESPPVMTLPLGVLAACAILLSLFGTPVFPWFHDYLSGHAAHLRNSIDVGVVATMLLSTAIVGAGLALGWWLYGRKPITDAAAPDALEQLKPDWFAVLRAKFFIDELYEISFIRWNAAFARFCGWLEQTIWTGAVSAVSLVVLGFSWLNRFFDEFVINLGFSGSCRGLAEGGGWLARLQTGRVQSYLRVLGVAFVVLVLFLIWGGGK
ncbi:MAG: NADH-quinone oxidoreductase subunit L [Verrucomicrobia bacterium]|nr:NADH-quinone oxidoreductase subunit L [Verrucomicrobiota bacterium]